MQTRLGITISDIDEVILHNNGTLPVHVTGWMFMEQLAEK
jgi:hypothetical protein